jgi:general L-amino acid transport system permease protein
MVEAATSSFDRTRVANARRGRFARAIRWMKINLFSSFWSSVLTLVFAALSGLLLYQLLSFAIVNAVWTGDREVCRGSPDGACWSFIAAKLDYLRYGSYPPTGRWRVDVVQLVGAVLVTWLLWPTAPRRNLAAALFFLVFPILAFVLLRGMPQLGLPTVETSLWGGLLVTLIMSVVGIVASLPIGIALALGRRSQLPVIRAFCVFYIEVVRGVPFITVLFMANFLLPLFVPDFLTPDRLLRPIIGTALFSAAYMAEVVRAGLQAIPKGQYEGSHALGLSYWKTMRLVILPQALTIVIPGIVSTFIGLFKDTTLVAVVGITDFLKAAEISRVDPNWAGPTISSTVYLFAGLVYWVICFGMSQYSQSMERRLSRDRK